MNSKGDLVKFALGLALAGLVSYFTALGSVEARLSVLEDRYMRLLSDIGEIKSDVKVLLRRDVP